MAHPIAARPALLDRQKLAEVTSATGALLLGVGIGVYLAGPLAKLALWFVVLGFLLHGWGMFDRHRALIAVNARPPLWWRALYAGCWAGLVALVAYAIAASM